MTRNRDRDGIRAARLRDGADGRRHPDAPGDIGIACRRSSRDLAERLPHPLLKRRSPDVKRKIDRACRCFDKRHDVGHEALEPGVTADQPRFRKAVLQITDQPVRVVAEHDCAHAFAGRRDQYGSQRAFTNREVNALAGTSCPIPGGRHAQHAWCGRIETTVRVETSAVDGVGNRGLARQLVADAPGAVCGAVRLRRHAGYRPEDPMKMESTHAGRCGQGIETGDLILLLDEPTRPRHRGRALIGQPGLVRPAALTRAEPRPLGVSHRGVEADVLTPRLPRGTGRTAVHPCRAD